MICYLYRYKIQSTSIITYRCDSLTWLFFLPSNVYLLNVASSCHGRVMCVYIGLHDAEVGFRFAASDSAVKGKVKGNVS